jgi:acyl dehydratase
MKYWEELESGQVFQTGTITIDAADIIEFASEFDPQPYHLDPTVAEKSIFGGHCASGWQVCALMMRLLADTLERDHIPSRGSPGVNSLRWLRPVFAGDTLHASITTTALHQAQHANDPGLVDVAIDVLNQNDQSVIVLETQLLIERRPTGANA